VKISFSSVDCIHFLNLFFGLQMKCSSVGLGVLLFERHGKNPCSQFTTKLVTSFVLVVL
jgi:hypothetical protein